VTFVQTLKDANGTLLGDLNVVDLNPKDKTFSALFVSKVVNGKNIIIYQVDANGFYGTFGQDSPGPGKERFSGPKFASVGTDSFTLNVLTNNGKDISDAQLVQWNKKKTAFKLFKPNFEDPIYTSDVPVGTLKDSKGLALGELSVVYSDTDKNVLKAVFVGTTTPNRSAGLYRILKIGFLIQMDKNKTSSDKISMVLNLLAWREIILQFEYFIKVGRLNPAILQSDGMRTKTFLRFLLSEE
jgi:hypothetical protein